MSADQENPTTTKVASLIPESIPGNESSPAASPASANAVQNEGQFVSETTERRNVGLRAPVERSSTKKKQALAVRPGRATGPRTAGGKSRSSKNAIRHGIFSSALLPSESRQFQRQVDELMQYFQPAGAGEEVLVQQIAMILCRQRRLPIAERAIIYDQRRVGEKRVRTREMLEAQKVAGQMTDGLVHRIGSPPNPCIVDSALKYLGLLQRAVKRGDGESALQFFQIIYGSSVTTRGMLGDLFVAWYEDTAPEAEGVGAGAAASARWEDMARTLVVILDEEIEGLRKLASDVEELQRAEQRCNTKVSLLPPEGALERLMRYEAHLDRKFERTLNQLERLQRLRSGQPLPPPLKLEVSQ